MYYVCLKVELGTCQDWQPYSSLFDVSTSDGMKIGGMFLSLCVFAFLLRSLLSFISRL